MMSVEGEAVVYLFHGLEGQEERLEGGIGPEHVVIGRHELPLVVFEFVVVLLRLFLLVVVLLVLLLFSAVIATTAPAVFDRLASSPLSGVLLGRRGRLVVCRWARFLGLLSLV
jgi:hypothetical protein